MAETSIEIQVDIGIVIQTEALSIICKTPCHEKFTRTASSKGKEKRRIHVKHFKNISIADMEIALLSVLHSPLHSPLSPSSLGSIWSIENLEEGKVQGKKMRRKKK